MESCSPFETKCSVCGGDIFLATKFDLQCSGCNAIIGRISNSHAKSRNKLIHMNNVLKAFHMNSAELDKLYEQLLLEIEKDKIEPLFVEAEYITNFLKKIKQPHYVTKILLYCRYKNKKFVLTDEIKEDIKIIFYSYTLFLQTNNSDNNNNSISYELIFNLIVKYLNLNLDFKLCPTRKINDKLTKSFNDFVNYLCEEYKNFRSNNEKFYILPETKSDIYDKKLLFV